MNKYAVLIGINEYHESLGTLKYCVSDAELMYETLMSEQCGFSQDNTLLLTDNQDSGKSPTYGNIHSWLGKWLSLPEDDDLVVVYFAGHGRHDNGDSMLVPRDATLDTVNVTGIKISYVQDLLERCKAKQKVLFLDACHSGSGRDVMPMTAQFYDQLQSSEGIYTIASCKQDQISHECDEKKHGIFTWALTNAIQKAIPDNNGRVTLDAIFGKCRQTITNWCKPRRITQMPVRISNTTGDIIMTIQNHDLEGQLKRAKEKIHSLQQENLSLADKKQNYNKQTPTKVNDSNWTIQSYQHRSIDRSEAALFTVIGGAVMGAGTGGLCYELLGLSTIASTFFGIFFSLPVPAFVLWLYYVLDRQMPRNKHYLAQAHKAAWSESDYIQGLAALRELKGMGINKGEAVTIAEQLGELAVLKHDNARAREIYYIARDKFGSSLARTALQKLYQSEVK